MSTKHTPGPWTVVEGNYPDRFGTSNALNVDHPCIYGEPDARLIAAAPEMLEQLIACEKKLHEASTLWIEVIDLRVEKNFNEQNPFYEIRNSLRALIAKATGQT